MIDARLTIKPRSSMVMIGNGDALKIEEGLDGQEPKNQVVIVASHRSASMCHSLMCLE